MEEAFLRWNYPNGTLWDGAALCSRPQHSVWLTLCCDAAVHTLKVCAVCKGRVLSGGGVLAAVSWCIGIQPRHRRLEHGEGYGDV